MLAEIRRLVTTVAGVEVIGEARDVKTAVARLSERVPDVLILDLQLPDGTGFDVIRAMKEFPRRPVIIVLSVHSEARSFCLQRGADFFLDKTTELVRLPEVLRSIMSVG